MRVRHAVGRECSGQAALETLIVVLIVSILLFGLLQVVLVLNGREILHHAAARAARSRAVGFNYWMATKALRVAAIPNSGQLLTWDASEESGWYPLGSPGTKPGAVWDRALEAEPPESPRVVFERARVPAYLVADNPFQAEPILDYAEWSRGSFWHEEQHGALGTGTLKLRVMQDFPLWMPLRSLIFPFVRTDEQGVGRVRLSGESEVGYHAAYYLEP